MRNQTEEQKEEYRRKLQDYYGCLKNQRKIYAKKSITVKALVLLRDSEIQLDCFRCLSPEEQTELEEVWKPNESFIGKKAREMIDQVKEHVLSEVAHYKNHTPPSEWIYEWEKANFKADRSKSWIPVMNMESNITAVEKSFKILKKLLQPHIKQPKLGDRFELIIERLSRSDFGWYRCMKRSSNVQLITNMYYVDVITNSTPYIIIDSSTSIHRARMRHSFPEWRLRSYDSLESWSDCSRCGAGGGEKRRRIECSVTLMENTSMSWLAKSAISYMQLFDKIPCRSSLIPVQLRTKLWSISDLEEIQSCKIDCVRSLEQKERIILGRNEFGRETIIDKVPPDEYRMNERLPPLRKAVKRDTVQGFETDPYILSCGRSNYGIFWALNESYISSASLLRDYPDKRIYINSDNQLIINHLAMVDDESFFSCHQSVNGDVLRTFSVIVNKGKQHQEIVEYIRFGFRYGAFILLILMVLSVMTNTNIHSEHFRRLSGIKLYAQRNQKQTAVANMDEKK